ncbi:ABC transporter ATP-binding protein [Vibrio sp. vnigr-6D03]|uniref:ABC transporter ATP-binding protein n=1 Tax=Vibrio sp. vnigr-6D03 TaxID=2058088 RepID=UPI000C32F0AB|nr:ABC transporter ATP-binding protein [Vibrio sp. vnigr-6D03]PKF81313.1 ABC transporter ATP-binding protein [Vibrio sp. vnigr-6D03]
MKQLLIQDLALKVGRKQVLKRVDAQFKAGEFSAILGPNGAGKTTLLKAVIGILPYSGNISATDKNGRALPSTSFSYLCQLNKSPSQLTVIEVVLLGLVHQLNWRISEEQEQKAENMLRELGLIGIATRPFSQLSGGQQQLVSLAQALVSQPDVLLLDEPTSALDLKHQVQVLDLARQYTLANNTITIAVLHDLSLAARYCDHLILLNDGEVQHSGSPDCVLEPEKLSQIYQVHVDVGCCIHGHTHVTPVRPL